MNIFTLVSVVIGKHWEKREPKRHADPFKMQNSDNIKYQAGLWNTTETWDPDVSQWILTIQQPKNSHIL